MPKMKTHPGAEKRAHMTKNGKKGGKLMRRKRPLGARGKATLRAKHAARKLVEVAPSNKKVFKRLLPGIKN